MAKRRPSGDGMIRNKGKNLWEGRITIGYKNDGSSMFKYVYGKTQREALQKLHKLLEEYKGIRLTEESNITVAQWLDRWLNEYMIFAVRESTWESYECMVRVHVNPHIGDKPLALLKTVDIQKMYNTLSKEGRVNKTTRKGAGLSDSYVRKIHMMLHEALEMAVSEKLIVKNPTVGTTVPKNNYPPMKVLNEAELQKFMAVIKADEIWRDFFYTELTTGLREGELCGLMWSDFDEEKNTLRVVRTVTRKKGGGLEWGETKTEAGRRTILLPPSTAEILKARRENVKGKWIFPNLYKPELPMHPQYAYNRLKTLLKNADLPQIRFHDLRHTFATLSLENGMDIKTLSEILGHESSATTLDVYSHVSDTMRMQAAVSIDRKIGGTQAQMPEPEKVSEESIKTQPEPKFEPQKRKMRKRGTGCVTKLSENCYEGKYSPNNAYGKRISRNVYAPTEAECEAKLAVLIKEMNAEIAAEKAKLKAEKTEGSS